MFDDNEEVVLSISLISECAPDVCPWTTTFDCWPKKFPAMSCTLNTVLFASTTTPFATLLDVLNDVEFICPLECLPNKSTLSTVNVPFDTDVVVTLALTNDSSS